MKKQLITTLLVCAAIAVQTNAQEFVHAGDYTIPVSAITRITATHQEHPSSLSLLLEQDENISLFTAALKATGWMEALKCYTDDNYGWATEQDRIDSCTWTNDLLVIRVSNEYDNVAYMPKRLIAHTLLIETDEVLATKGITSLEDLRTYAHSTYDPIYPEDAAVSNEKDPRNALNRFVAYHILPFKAGYYQLTPMDGDKLANNWNRGKWDIADWYETSMPHSLMKLSFPSSTQSGLYVNRRGVQSRADERGVFVRGAKVSSPTEMGGKGMGVNGNFFYIDDIIAYDQQTQQVVLNERMRIDCTTLSPDFITSGARGHEDGHWQRYNTYQGMYWSAANNSNRSMGFKPGAAENFEYDNDTHLHVRPRTLSFWSYSGDEINIQGRPFDVKVKLPSLPAGKYELRLGTCVNFASRAVVQFYIDDAAVGVPVDMRLSSTELFGWKSDSELGSEEAIAADDQRIRNYGWMKGPDTYAPGERSFWDSEATTMRGTSTTVRKIIGTFETDGKTDHYLRMKNVLTDTSANELDFDYIELVPESVYANEEVPEDRH